MGFGDAALDVRVLVARVTWTIAGVALAVLARAALWSRNGEAPIMTAVDALAGAPAVAA
jgi:hypothetical protein